MSANLEVNSATFVKASTTSDGGWRIQFDLPEGGESAVVLAALATLRGKVLKLSIDEEV